MDTKFLKEKFTRAVPMKEYNRKIFKENNLKNWYRPELREILF